VKNKKKQKKLANSNRNSLNDPKKHSKSFGTKQRIMGKNRSSGKSGININTIIMSIFLAIVTIYIARTVTIFLNREQVKTVSVKFTNGNQIKDFEGIITRNETVYKSEQVGTIHYTSEFEVDIKHLKNKVLELQTLRGDDIVKNSAQARYENELMKSQVDNFNFIDLQYKFSNLIILKQNLDHRVEIRNKNLLSEDSESIKNLTDELKISEARKNENIYSIKANETGILSFSTDDMEEVFNFSNLNTIQPEQMKIPNMSKISPNNSNVEKNQSIFKVVESNEWYISAFIGNDYIYDFEPSSINSKTIYVEKNFEYYPLEVFIYKVDKGENDSLVTFRVTRSILDYIGQRKIKFKLVDTKYEGFKIPESAVVTKTYIKVPVKFVNEASSTVIIKNNEVYEKVTIKLYNKEDEFYYIRQDFGKIKLGDVLFLDDDKEQSYILKEVKIEKGVFIANFGYAYFQKIIINDTQKENGYYLLDMKLNPKMKVQDIIVQEATNVEENQAIDSK
jgi:hypothetical protein